MFGFANALLLALFAAAGVDLVLALHRKAVGQLFTVPHYLFGDWGGEARARWGQRAFLLALMLYEFTVVFCNSMARENWPFLQGQLAPVLDMIMYTLLCGKILLGTRYTWRELICAGALYFVARWVYFGPCDGAVGSQRCAAAAQFAGVFRLRRTHAGAGGSAAFCGYYRP